MANQSIREKFGFGCALLFFLPFLLGGIAALSLGVGALIHTGEWSKDVVGPMGVGSVFILVGGGMITALFMGVRAERESKRRQAESPNEPWRWRKDWAAGRVKCGTPGGLFVYWLFGLCFGGAGVIILLNIGEITRESPMGYFALLFPLFGGGMLAGAVYATLRWYKYGRTFCDLLTNPGVVGGWFRALIWARVPLDADGTVTLQLTSYHRYVTGSGKHRTTHRMVQWQETNSVSRDTMVIEPDGTLGIPVAFYVPPDCKPTTPAEPQDRIEWDLTAVAKVPGIDFRAEFTVPLFWTEDSSTEAPETPPTATAASGAAPYRPTIEVLEGVDSLVLYAPPGRSRSRGMTFSMTLFTIIWTGIIVLMVYSGDVPVLFPLVFGFFDLLLLSGTIWLWFGHVRMRLEHGAIHLSKTIFGIGSHSQISFADITDMEAHITMQSGSTPYYTIRLRTASGTKHTLGGIREKAEVNDLIGRMRSFMKP